MHKSFAGPDSDQTGVPPDTYLAGKSDSFAGYPVFPQKMYLYLVFNKSAFRSLLCIDIISFVELFLILNSISSGKPDIKRPDIRYNPTYDSSFNIRDPAFPRKPVY